MGQRQRNTGRRILGTGTTDGAKSRVNPVNYRPRPTTTTTTTIQKMGRGGLLFGGFMSVPLWPTYTKFVNRVLSPL